MNKGHLSTDITPRYFREGAFAGQPPERACAKVLQHVRKLLVHVFKLLSKHLYTVSMYEWELQLSQSLREPTDATPSPEAKLGPHTQQQLPVKAKSQEFKVTRSQINIKGSHQHTDGRRSAPSDLQTHPDVFTSQNNWLLGGFFPSSWT